MTNKKGCSQKTVSPLKQHGQVAQQANRSVSDAAREEHTVQCSPPFCPVKHSVVTKGFIRNI